MSARVLVFVVSLAGCGASEQALSPDLAGTPPADLGMRLDLATQPGADLASERADLAPAIDLAQVDAGPPDLARLPPGQCLDNQAACSETYQCCEQLVACNPSGQTGAKTCCAPLGSACSGGSFCCAPKLQAGETLLNNYCGINGVCCIRVTGRCSQAVDGGSAGTIATWNDCGPLIPLQFDPPGC